VSRSRVATAVAGLLVSLAVSLVLWYLFRTPAVFLFVPFVPFLFRRGRSPERRRCPACGFETDEASVEYCPRDGRRLERVGDRDPS